MSTTVQMSDDDRARLEEVTLDSCATNWFLCEHAEDNPEDLVCVGTGSDGVAELSERLDDAKCMYGLARFTLTHDMSETVKFAFFTWVGKDVPLKMKNKVGVRIGSVQLIFDRSHASFTFNSEDKTAVTQEFFETELKVQSGIKSKVLDATEAKDRPERGFTAGVSSKSGAGNIGKAVGKQGTSFGGFMKSTNTGPSISLEDNVMEEIAAVRSDDDSINCVCIKFRDNNIKNPLYHAASGKTLAEIEGQFVAEDVACVLVKVLDHIDDIPTYKYVYISWVGEKVKPMTKGKLPPLSGKLEEIFAPNHVKINASSLAEVSDRVVSEKVSSASGSKSRITSK